jgi:uncharacterized repeat protein (TIGR03803 family)
VTAGSHAIVTLGSFNGGNGEFPYGSVLEDGSGNLFGTAPDGGASNNGTVFEVVAGSGAISTLASFTGTNGSLPQGGLVRDASGNFYGTAYGGGAFGDGTVFELPSGSSTITALASFNGANGVNPYCTLVRDSSGNLFGNAPTGGASNDGTVFELPAGSGTIAALASFNGTNGANPHTGLVVDSSGNLYGTTAAGGAFSDGTIFEYQSAIQKSATSAALVSSANPSVSGQPVTLVGLVSASNSGTPTGTVAFVDGATTLGTAALNAGVATFTTAALAVGTHSLTAVYSGDGNFTGSTSASLPQTVNRDASVSTLVSSVNPSAFGEKATFFVVEQAAAPGSGTPTGTVTFLDGASALGAATLNASGVAAFTTTKLTVGNHAITVSYGGDGNFTANTSAALTQTVNKDATTITVTSSNNPATFGQAITFTATVKASWPGSGLPGGTVTLKDNGASLGSGTLAGGKATFSTSTLAAGNHIITAVYSGNGNFKTSTSIAITQTVTAAASVSLILASGTHAGAGLPVSFSATTIALDWPTATLSGDRGSISSILTQTVTAASSGSTPNRAGEEDQTWIRAERWTPVSTVGDPQRSVLAVVDSVFADLTAQPW